MTPRLSMAAFAAVSLLQLSQAQSYVPVPKGCYTSSGDMVLANTNPFQSYSTCENTCTGLNKPVFGVQYKDCWCGDLLPPTNAQAPASTCNKGCPGYGTDMCGSLNGAWSVFLTGISSSVGSSGGHGNSGGSSSSPMAMSMSASTVTKPTTIIEHRPGHQHPKVKTVRVGQTIVKTIAPATSPTSPASHSPSQSASKSGSGNGGGSSTNTVGIAVGVVVGLVALGAIVGGIFFCMKRRRRNNDRAHRRTSSINSFIGRSGSTIKSPGGGSDSRLDPGLMVERRQSGGSVFADNQDYSRRILKVTNPDG